MIYSKAKNFLFIHVPKTAGTSLRDALEPYREGRQPRFGRLKRFAYKRGLVRVNMVLMRLLGPFDHLPAWQARQLLGETRFDSSWKFGVVRDPEDWVVSHWLFVARRPRHELHRLAKSSATLADWVEIVAKHHADDIRQFGGIQAAYLLDQHGTLLVDQLLRFEHLSADAATLSLRIDVPIELGHANKSTRTADEATRVTTEIASRLRSLLPQDYALMAEAERQYRIKDQVI